MVTLNGQVGRLVGVESLSCNEYEAELFLLQRSVVSGSADKNVKFWDFELVTDKDYSLTR